MTSKVGPTMKADMAGAGVMGGSHTLSDAVGHLAKEHPHNWDDMAPMQHKPMRPDYHEPLHGMKPSRGNRG